MTPEPRKPPDRRPLWAVVGAASLAAIVGLVLWLLPDSDGGGSTAGKPQDSQSGSTTGGPGASTSSGPLGVTQGGDELSPSEFLVTKTTDSGKKLIAFDDANGNRSTYDSLPADVGLPTISDDRRSMVYLSGSQETGWVPTLASADGSKVRPLLNEAARSRCPFTGRPAFSLDGALVALVCYDQGLTSMGLWTVNLDDRSLGRQLDSSSDVTGSATWTGDDEVVYQKTDDSSGQSRLWLIARNGGEATDITPDFPGSYSHPDWSRSGLLVLVGKSSADVGRVASMDEELGLTFFGDDGAAKSPTWSASGDEAIWIQSAPGGGSLLWTGSAGGKATSIDIPELRGQLGPPAWGTR